MRRTADGASLQMIRCGVISAWATLAGGLSLAACTSGGGHATSQDLLGLSRMQDASGIRTRELLPEEKAVISHAVGLLDTVSYDRATERDTVRELRALQLDASDPHRIEKLRDAIAW